MFEYILNLIPRLRQFNSDLSKQELFVDKKFTLLRDDLSIHQYRFLRGGRLILTIDGVGVQGTWELLVTGELLLNQGNSQISTLDFDFLHPDVLIMKYSGSSNLPFVIFNQDRIPDKNVVGFLENFELAENSRQHGILHIVNNQEVYQLEESGIQYFRNQDGSFFNGELIAREDSSPYNVGGTIQEIKLIENGVITQVYYLNKITLYNDLGYVVFKQSDRDSIQIGDQIIEEKSSIEMESGRFQIFKNSIDAYLVYFNRDYFVTDFGRDYRIEKWILALITGVAILLLSMKYLFKLI